ncbi:MAG: type IV pilus twitching motility protein PilT [Phycisphaerales bacterium]|nr:type IV pilus twitching motility protein PilT [Phycisphaerales bacterium]
MNMHAMLTEALHQGASDIHLVPGHVPMYRIDTCIKRTTHPELTASDVDSWIDAMTSEAHRAAFATAMDVDLSWAVPDIGRFRVNIHRQRGVPAIAMRVVNDDVPPLETLGLPPIIEQLAMLPRGLVLVTGDTGSGKSTTLAAMIALMNARQSKHIITLEDPVEYTFESDTCLIEQRELGEDLPSFASGLRHALRQDPDTILVGEMRDLETTALAMSAAETGHLVLSTLHTVNASQTVERIIDMYPAGQQNQIRAMLGNTLQAVVSQTLLRRIDQRGMAPAVEILLCTPAVRNLIREARTFEIPNVIETSRRQGMVSMDASIQSLFFNGMISREDAISHASHADAMDSALAA